MLGPHYNTSRPSKREEFVFKDNLRISQNEIPNGVLFLESQRPARVVFILSRQGGLSW
jgi:hypothetical protein